MTSKLNQPQFQTPEKAREYLEAIRWPNGAVCPHCGVVGAHYKLIGKATRPGLYKCKDCREQFSATVGTVFERSKIKLNVWLQAVYLLCSSKKGMSSHQLHRMLGVTYKTAWFMTHRIREAMNGTDGGLLGSGGGIVEADETFWGNKKLVKKIRGTKLKMKVLSLVERGGKVRSFHIPNLKAKTLAPILREQIAKEAHLMTDEAHAYIKIGKEFASHSSVVHSAGEYSRGNAHVNNLESYFSIFKRGLIGTYHHVGEQHLKRYAKEFDFRYNHRNVTDSERAASALKGISGKRLTYRRTHA
jgi:transposase-like protein